MARHGNEYTRNTNQQVVDKFFDSKEKAEKYSEEQDKEETRHFVNIGRINRSVEELEVK